MKNLEKFIINSTNEFHILRHFQDVDDSYKKSLIGKPYWYYDYNKKKFIFSTISHIDIENALQTLGTKFFKNIIGIESPKKLLKRIKNKFQELLADNKVFWIDMIEYKTFTFIFDYECSVGTINCLQKDTLSLKNKERIQSALRSKCLGEESVFVQTFSSIKLSETKQLPFYTITAFPHCFLLDTIEKDNLVFVV
jgi:hypothetical protein